MVRADYIPTSHLDLLTGTHFAHVATLNPDNSIQISPVWITYDTESHEVVFNTAKGRKKVRNLKIGSSVAISILDQNNPYRYITIQGAVSKLSDNQLEAVPVIDELGTRYKGWEKYPLAEGELRVNVKVTPQYVHVSG